MKDISILGISAFYHDSAACLVKNGDIVAAAQEERFTRKKGEAGFPHYSIDYCLKEGGIKIEDVDEVVYYDKPILKFDRILASYIHTAPKGLSSFLQSMPLWLKDKLWVEETIKKELGYRRDILFTQHHQSHAASAFFPSPFEEAAILTIDGVGEWTTTTIGKGEGNKLDLLKMIEFPHSLGLLYSAFTYYCGFRVNSGEYKLMGLAPYGKPVYADLIKKEIIRISEDGSFLLNEKYFNYIAGLRMTNRKFEKLFGHKKLASDEKPTAFYMDIAASIQHVFNEILVLIAKQAKKITGSENLCIAGGVGLNCVANTKILKEAGFKKVWVQPASGDAGGALGAALYVHYGFLRNKRSVDGIHDSQKGSYLGPEFTDDEIESVLKAFGSKFMKMPEDELVRTVSKAIQEQKVIGWFQGRMEFGPRALGNRSILGDARSESMQSKMNLKIKFRESFRPFAPAILEERSSEYFDLDGGASPYMLFVAQVRPEHLVRSLPEGKTGLELLNLKRSNIPAVTHLDNSARLQTVSKVTNTLFHKLLTELDTNTGCPLVINTSFNVRGEPVVCSPKDAYLSFMSTNIDMLAIGNYILFKEEQAGLSQDNKELMAWKKSLIRD